MSDTDCLYKIDAMLNKLIEMDRKKMEKLQETFQSHTLIDRLETRIKLLTFVISECHNICLADEDG